MSSLPAVLIAQLLQAGNGIIFLVFYYTYVLRSKFDNTLYIGWTQDLVSRLKDHNSGKVRATKSKTPYKLVHYEAGVSREKAIEREKQLKTGFGRKYLKSRI